MNCIEVNEKMAALFDTTVDDQVREEFFRHFSTCNDCRAQYEEYRSAIDKLKPKFDMSSEADWNETSLRKFLHDRDQTRSHRIKIGPAITPTWKKIILAAAVALLVILFPFLTRHGRNEGTVSAANTLLRKSIYAITRVNTIYMELNVRTAEHDNFDYIGLHEDFVPHKLWVEFGDRFKWRIEKPGRIVVMDGENQYMYCPPMGTALQGDQNAGFAGWMKTLLNPEEILRKEKQFASKNEAQYLISENGNTINLTVKSKAQGDFRNAFALNTSIPESNNRRVYTFNKSTNFLETFEIYIDEKGKEVKVLELKSIRYNDPIENARFTIALPDDLHWVSAKALYNDKQTGIAGITSEEAARQFFTGCQKEDWSIVRQLTPGFMNFLQLQFAIKAEYGGLTIISIGKPFKSGHYSGEFVPYSIKKKNGAIKTWNIALRNDNPEKKWVVDGGI